MADTTHNQLGVPSSDETMAVESQHAKQRREILAAMIDGQRGVFRQIDKPRSAVRLAPSWGIEIPLLGRLLHVSTAIISHGPEEHPESTVDMRLSFRRGHVQRVTLREGRTFPDAHMRMSTLIVLDGDGVLHDFYSIFVLDDGRIIDDKSYDESPNAEEVAHRRFLKMTEGITDDTRNGLNQQ